MLKIDQIDVGFDGIPVLRGVSLEVGAGALTAVVGSNNAGKSTTLRAIAGLAQTQGGTIELDGQRIDGIPPHKRSNLGITLIPEGRQLFPDMSVQENILMGGFRHRKDKGSSGKRLDWVLDLFPALKDKLQRKAKTLSGGEQQMVSMGRGLMSKPKLLLIDEPSLGLAPVIVEQIFETIEQLNQEGFSILLVEQNLQMALSIAQRGYVIENGTVVMSDSGQALINNKEVREKYLGM